MSGEKDRKMSTDSRKSNEKVRKMSNDSKKSNEKKRKMSGEKAKKDPTKYIISKKTPTLLNPKVDPCFDESSVFVACSNTILVFSLQTGLHIRTMRSRPRDQKNKATGDVHKANIILLTLKDGHLLSLCS
jgi:hypothetical protein